MPVFKYENIPVIAKHPSKLSNNHLAEKAEENIDTDFTFTFTCKMDG